MRNIKKIETNILILHNSLKCNKIDFNNIPTFIIELLIVALQIAKLFTNDEIDNIINEVIEMLRKILNEKH